MLGILTVHRKPCPPFSKPHAIVERTLGAERRTCVAESSEPDMLGKRETPSLPGQSLWIARERAVLEVR